jgi:type VI secretion system protein ImpF
MSELTSTEKIQPCLLDRLTDQDPNTVQESRTNRVVSLARYKDAVLRDLRWLLNSKKPPESDSLNRRSAVAESVLNYGVTDLCGLTRSILNISEVERSIEQSLKRFEPRILRTSIKVRALPPTDASSPCSLGFEIRGQLWAQPVPEELFIRTEIDLETGELAFR